MVVLTGTVVPAVSVVPAEVVGATTLPPCGGIWMVEPASSWVSGESPLAAASESTLNPSWAAIELSDSPRETTWTK